MIGKVYRPEHVIRTDAHHTEITKKHCAGSAYDDKQKTMKKNLIKAAKKEGINKDVTEVTALADGANNCWNVLEALLPFCLSVLFILDRFHLGKYIQNIRTSIPQFGDVLAGTRSAVVWRNQRCVIPITRHNQGSHRPGTYSPLRKFL